MDQARGPVLQRPLQVEDSIKFLHQRIQECDACLPYTGEAPSNMTAGLCCTTVNMKVGYLLRSCVCSHCQQVITCKQLLRVGQAGKIDVRTPSGHAQHTHCRLLSNALCLWLLCSFAGTMLKPLLLTFVWT